MLVQLAVFITIMTLFTVGISLFVISNKESTWDKGRVLVVLGIVITFFASIVNW